MTMSDSIQDIGFIVQKMYTMVVNFYMIVTYFKMDFLFCNEHMDGESIISVSCHSNHTHLGKVGLLCFTSQRQRGYLETAPPFTVPCDGRKARFVHRSLRESNPGRHQAVRYTTAAPSKLLFGEETLVNEICYSWWVRGNSSLTFPTFLGKCSTLSYFSYDFLIFQNKCKFLTLNFLKLYFILF